MELTFITIHDLTHDAKVLFASLSISDVLGWIPEEVIGKSGFEFFSPREAPFARSVYGRGVQLDRAAVLHYCSLRARDGTWKSCECAFTIVYNVMVVSVSVYRRSSKSHQRALDAPCVRRLFASSPRDPRYHMLAHLSTKFTMPSVRAVNEPRAALILNRFTRTLSVLYATDAVSAILGVTSTELTGTSFYECIQEDCLQDAINCLERAKQNDSIAYLRFFFRDPRNDHPPRSDSPGSYSGSKADGDAAAGVDHHPSFPQQYEGHSNALAARVRAGQLANDSQKQLSRAPKISSDEQALEDEDRDDSPASNQNVNSEEAIFDREPRHSSDPTSEPSSIASSESNSSQDRAPPVELEAVISCTSDGLVVVLRRAKAIMPVTFRRPAHHPYAQGLFASPWATTPLLPPPTIFNQGFNPGLGSSEMMKSIEECACFAWSLGSVNASLLEHASGQPQGEASPQELNLWDPLNGQQGVHIPSSQKAAGNQLPGTSSSALDNGTIEYSGTSSISKQPSPLCATPGPSSRPTPDDGMPIPNGNGFLPSLHVQKHSPLADPGAGNALEDGRIPFHQSADTDRSGRASNLHAILNQDEDVEMRD